jgi:hypothetical protein
MEKRNLKMGSRIIEILRNNIENVSLTTYLHGMLQWTTSEPVQG